MADDTDFWIPHFEACRREGAVARVDNFSSASTVNFPTPEKQ
ncbi:hypothetical protein [Pseudoduganella namucuonensis]|uniref:Uncharacterized protein n=1 Tax=Pseudoduganella namucuonensis TaxID=1035707 RepID=A0A1I7M7A5_9BURK|nr:hypothetical protein [Pseudoduganella namucuonensis]SFV17829.1 hypothetical protein SAMN05216552_10765 [Pseudoduganella namucuonensis]